MSNSNNDLLKLVDNLKNKVKKLELQSNKKYVEEITTYKIHMPLNNDKNTKNKKYIGLLFNNNYDSSSETFDYKDSKSFIKLKKNNNIINYSITLKIDTNCKDCDKNKDNLCSLSLGIRDGNNKIKIIKGSKVQYDINKSVVDSHIIINNIIIYESLENQELCLIASLSKKCTVVNKKSIIKILNL